MLLDEQLDMVVGTRRHEAKEAYRRGHVLGNRVFTGLLAGLFGRSFSDIFSGYRVFSRRFVKSFPVLSAGFEIETEISVHALELRMPVGEVETAYGARPEGSQSKLSTYSRRLADPEDDRHSLPRRAAGVVLRGDRRVAGAAAIILAIPLVVTYVADRPGAALPDRDPRHRNDHRRRALLLRRPHPRHRHPRPPRGPPARLPLAVPGPASWLVPGLNLSPFAPM